MKITALQPIRHDEIDYAIGDEVSLPDEQAQALIDVGSAESDESQAQVKAAQEAASKPARTSVKNSPNKKKQVAKS